MIVGFIALLVFGSVASLTIGLGRRTSSSLESRIQELRERTEVPEDEVDLSAPFAERVMKPSMEALARAAGSVLPASVLTNIEKQLIMAGSPMTLNTFVAIWAASVIFLTGFFLFAVLLVGTTVGLQQAIAVLACGAIGWMLPRIWLKGRVRERQKVMLRALPDALDLITTSVEAGLGLDAALARVAEKSSGPLADEISRTLRDVAMGKLRREALMELSQRVGLEELSSFINSVIQAEQLGVGVAQVLRVQSEQMRMRRRQRAEKAAHEAPIKMLFPLVLFIFPAFMLVILGPAVIRIAETLSR